MKKKWTFTVEISPEDQSCLGIVSDKLGISVGEFLLHCALQKLEDIEDEHDLAYLRKIEEEGAEVVSWDEVKGEI